MILTLVVRNSLHTTDLFNVLAVMECGGNVMKLTGRAELTMIDNTPESMVRPKGVYQNVLKSDA